MVRRIIGLLTVLAMVLMACFSPVVFVTESPDPTSTVLATPIPTLLTSTPTEEFGIVTVLANVWTRDSVSNVRVGSYLGGKVVRAVCRGEWCYPANTDLKFWRGCSDNNPANMGCEAER